VGRNKVKSQNLAPERTMRSLRRDADMAREHGAIAKDMAKGEVR